MIFFIHLNARYVLAETIEDIPSLRNKTKTTVKILSVAEAHVRSMLLIDKQIDLTADPSLKPSTSQPCIFDPLVKRILWLI